MTLQKHLTKSVILL